MEDFRSTFTSKGGRAAILVHSSIPLTTQLHVVAVRLSLRRPLTVSSVYLGLGSPVSYDDLISLVRQLPPPLLLLGDFNLHHPLCGDTVTSPYGHFLTSQLPAFSL